MKITHIETVVAVGAFANSSAWSNLRRDIQSAVRAIDWPDGTGRFVIYPESGKKRRAGNGVIPIKKSLMKRLERNGWELEEPLDIAVATRPGKLDAVRYTPLGPLALEWETGNISSSHRALNKMAIGLLSGSLCGGLLIVPARNLAQYLTDRIGNFEELVPYLPLWRAIPYSAGILEIVVVEHDGTSLKVPRIPKGTSGRARE